MNRSIYQILGTLLALLVACSALPRQPEPPPMALLPTVTPVTPTALPTPTATAPSPTTVASDSARAKLAELAIAPEEYAWQGDPAAPVTIIEYSDYGCPFCRIYAATTFPALKERYIDSGVVFYIYKDFPVVSEQGALAAQAAECAGAQGGYWPMHHKLFANPGEWNVDAAQALPILQRYAGALELDAAALRTCLTDQRYADEVRADLEEGWRLGLNGTPAFIINGKLLSGAHQIDTFATIIAQELAER
ncbi:DsbA family protein [Kallotenue papyrolyticum]|uniref:DsbA family protein n=1 Tax=Kallotenue papyrolyticum TaxID=1325125 RepID=UPI00046E9937|nr:thioredoxin domain-containing protein [Kallotenue papyrolyticum]